MGEEVREMGPPLSWPVSGPTLAYGGRGTSARSLRLEETCIDLAREQGS